MTRIARKRSETGIYHVMIRGINRQVIFEDDEDRTRFLETIRSYKEVSKYKVYAYCLMGNHVHLLMGETDEPIGQSIKRICGSFVYWYNWTHERIGHLFQERFKSEVIEDDTYFLTVFRYIHQNPLKAGLVSEINKYKWSSYREYFGKSRLVDTEFALRMFAGDNAQALVQLKRFLKETNEDQCLDYEGKKRLLDSDIRGYLLQYGISNTSILQQMEKSQRDDIIRAVKSIDGVTVRQLSRITGISKSVIDRA
jgi:putative transposase